VTWGVSLAPSRQAARRKVPPDAVPRAGRCRRRLALFVPGLGQAVLGRPRRGAAFFGIVLATLLTGLALDRGPVAPTAEAGAAFS